VSFDEVISIGRNVVETKIPFNGVMWYPGGSMKRWRVLHQIEFWLFQMIPAVVLDGLLVLLGYKPV
jgi:fatty acyl-CoA reductase